MQCISVDNLFSLKLLNDRISAFNYGFEIANKPSLLSSQHITATGHLKQSGEHLLIA